MGRIKDFFFSDDNDSQDDPFMDLGPEDYKELVELGCLDPKLISFDAYIAIIKFTNKPAGVTQ